MVEKKKVINYSSILKPGQNAASNDQKIFNAYAKNEISLYRCFELFMGNSIVGLIDKSYWDREQFKNWLRMLGYYNPKDNGLA